MSLRFLQPLYSFSNVRRPGKPNTDRCLYLTLLDLILIKFFLCLLKSESLTWSGRRQKWLSSHLWPHGVGRTSAALCPSPGGCPPLVEGCGEDGVHVIRVNTMMSWAGADGLQTALQVPSESTRHGGQGPLRPGNLVGLH